MVLRIPAPLACYWLSRSDGRSLRGRRFQSLMTTWPHCSKICGPQKHLFLLFIGVEPRSEA